ncbi:response regulator transcription factor [Cellulomonas sp. JH27-2]|uniref:response regulator transcription factor n=1 Tax=Cellulomonas sp. JH27-2 TaxID=2774139 RepID=UPI001782A608|nr:LuxR C-terminal-related transcriptional regulator [Cellulomonas sp. JH27-2]MBD8059985.1 response regulator transcription factor [Cellulomonas sp. JH27-2]
MGEPTAAGWTGYRATGIRLVARALGCTALTLVEQDVRGRSRLTCWDDEGAIAPRPALAVPAGALVRRPLLRPAIDDDGAIVLVVRAGASGLAAWRLERPGGFDADDVAAAERIVPVLADPGMHRRPTAAAASDVLTAREAQILALVGRGLTSGAVARRCGISVRTVHKHLEQAYRKLDCHDRLSAVLLARDTGLLSRAALEPAV